MLEDACRNGCAISDEGIDFDELFIISGVIRKVRVKKGNSTLTMIGGPQGEGLTSGSGLSALTGSVNVAPKVLTYIQFYMNAVIKQMSICISQVDDRKGKKGTKVKIDFVCEFLIKHKRNIFYAGSRCREHAWKEHTD
jgi:hypothetical protein